MSELDEQIQNRREKRQRLVEAGINPYPNDFKPRHTSADFKVK